MHALKQEKEERSKDREIRQRDEDNLAALPIHASGRAVFYLDARA
jgi:hypothetical protein